MNISETLNKGIICYIICVRTRILGYFLNPSFFSTIPKHRFLIWSTPRTPVPTSCPTLAPSNGNEIVKVFIQNHKFRSHMNKKGQIVRRAIRRRLSMRHMSHEGLSSSWRCHLPELIVWLSRNLFQLEIRGLWLFSESGIFWYISEGNFFPAPSDQLSLTLLPSVDIVLTGPLNTS